MATFALLSPLNVSVESNPGTHFITDGIKWLIRQVDSNANFLPIDLLDQDPQGWRLAARLADILVLCGNPRFNLDDSRTGWDWKIWVDILSANDSGIPFVDLWAGAAHAYPVTTIEQMTAGLAGLTKTQTILSYESRASLCIARDAVAERLFATANDKTHLLPCSTWFAAAQHHVKPAPKDRNCITIRKMPGYGWIIDRVLQAQQQLEREKPTFVLTHSIEDFDWAANRRNVSNLVCLSDPWSLLHFYARVDKLMSFRTHGTIPALSLGAQFCDFSIDSRSLAVAEFGVESCPFIELNEPSFVPQFSRPQVEPDEEKILLILADTLARCGIVTGS